MSNTQFTPGPWKVFRGLTHSYDILSTGKNNLVLGHFTYEKNAVIAAAAPEMYEVIDGFLKSGYYSTEVGNNAIELMRRINPDYGTEV